MSPRPNKNDISIGDDRWITFGDLGGGQSCAIEIDAILAQIMPFIEELETECVAACCGIDAFDLRPGNIETILAKRDAAGIEEIKERLASVQDEVARLPSDIVLSTRINQYFRKEVILEILAHIRAVIENCRIPNDDDRLPEL